VAPACNPGNLGGRDQEDRDLKPAGTKSSRDSISKNPSQKQIGLVKWLKMKGLSSSPSTEKKKVMESIEEIH
jgi:hypothetical protein